MKTTVILFIFYFLISSCVVKDDKTIHCQAETFQDTLSISVPNTIIVSSPQKKDRSFVLKQVFVENTTHCILVIEAVLDNSPIPFTRPVSKFTFAELNGDYISFHAVQIKGNQFATITWTQKGNFTVRPQYQISSS